MRTHTRWWMLLEIVAVLAVAASPLKAQLGAKTQLFGQCAAGGGATTLFSIHNPGTSSITVTVDLFESNGSSLLQDHVSLGVEETKTLSYGGTAGTVSVGWARLSAAKEFVATVFFKVAQLGNVGVLPGEQTSKLKLFAYLGKGIRTAVAFANPSVTATSNLTARIFDVLGVFQGQTIFTLAPLNHKALYLDEPPFNMSDDGWVEIAASEPVVALTLRQDNNLLSSAPVIAPQTAAISGYEQVVSTVEFTNLAGASFGSASCPAGKKALGGTAYIDWLYSLDRPLAKLQDYPSNDTTWHAVLANYNDHAITGGFKVVVICAKCE